MAATCTCHLLLQAKALHSSETPDHPIALSCLQTTNATVAPALSFNLLHQQTAPAYPPRANASSPNRQRPDRYASVTNCHRDGGGTVSSLTPTVSRAWDGKVELQSRATRQHGSRGRRWPTAPCPSPPPPTPPKVPATTLPKHQIITAPPPPPKPQTLRWLGRQPVLQPPEPHRNRAVISAAGAPSSRLPGSDLGSGYGRHSAVTTRGGTPSGRPTANVAGTDGGRASPARATQAPSPALAWPSPPSLNRTNHEQSARAIRPPSPLPPSDRSRRSRWRATSSINAGAANLDLSGVTPTTAGNYSVSVAEAQPPPSRGHLRRWLGLFSQ